MMFECLILGDSIAAGLHNKMPDCIGYTKGGYNSWQWNKTYYQFLVDKDARYAIISLGSNDHQGVDTTAELEKLRANLYAKKVYWVLPAIKWEIQNIITNIARKNGDYVVKIDGLSKDGIHPTNKGYTELANKVRIPFDNR